MREETATASNVKNFLGGGWIMAIPIAPHVNRSCIPQVQPYPMRLALFAAILLLGFSLRLACSRFSRKLFKQLLPFSLNQSPPAYIIASHPIVARFPL